MVVISFCIQFLNNWQTLALNYGKYKNGSKETPAKYSEPIQFYASQPTRWVSDAWTLWELRRVWNSICDLSLEVLITGLMSHV